MEKMLSAIKQMQNCIHELRQEVEYLREDSGIQLGESTFDHMDSAIKNLNSSICDEDDEEFDEIGGFIKWLRKSKGLTLMTLSGLSGISQPYLSQLEKGDRIPSPSSLRALTPHLNVRYYDLMLKAGYLNENDLEEIIVDSKN